MSNKLMTGLWRYMIKIPPFLWEKQALKMKKRMEEHLNFMTEEHRRVHHFVVRELPRVGKPISAEFTAKKLDLSLARVTTILDELETSKILVWNEERNVVWAYPVTVDATPHHITFDSGERLYAAGAADAIATPFVQGRLRGESLSVAVKTECAHCSKQINLEIDNDLNYSIKEEGADPIVFVPNVDILALDEPNIIDSFGKLCVFFWSEEHAREYRRKVHRVGGAYFRLDQLVFGTKIIQSAIFGFK